MKYFIWNNNRGTYGRLRLSSPIIRVIDEGSFEFRKTYDYLMTDYNGELHEGYITEEYLNELMTDNFLIEHNQMEPIKCIQKLKIE